MVMLKYCLCQRLLFYEGNTSKVLAQYKVALVSEIIIAFKCKSLQAWHGSYQFLLFVLNVTQMSSHQSLLGETCRKRWSFHTILEGSFLAVALYLPFEN